VTNLVAIVVTLVTNTIVTNNGQHEWQGLPCPDGILGCTVYHARESGRWIKEPDEEQTEIQVVERRVAHTEIDGQAFDNLIGERIISSTTRTRKKFVEWREIAFRTNDLQARFLTNISVRSLNNLTNWTVIVGGRP